MDATIHCPHCRHDLTVPVFAAGHRARCPSCREVFVVPELNDSLDDTVCAWIEQDVEQFVETRHASVEQSLQHAPAAAIPGARHGSPDNGPGPGHGSDTPRLARPAPAGRGRKTAWPTQLSDPEQRRKVLHASRTPADPEHPHGSRWDKLSPRLRQRLEVWLKFRENERFRHFYPDSDFGPNELGSAGVVLTDQRLVYRKAHHFGAVERWDADTAILVNTRGSEALLTLARGGDRDRMVRLSHHDAEQLAAALARGGGFSINHVDE